jgi:pSer/pThr/pTyr-binding forkhead associated (FHA) protein
MIKCRFCNTNHPENTLFCEECGSFLEPGDEQATGSLQRQVADQLIQSRTNNGNSRTLAISIEDGPYIELPRSENIVLGRLDPSRGSFPDVDLSDHALKKGVSRQHARIIYLGVDAFIEDLGSLNGTFLNESRMVPEQPYPIRDGDQVQLGNLALTIHMKPISGRDG